MAKLTIDEAKLKLVPIAKTIEAMKAAGIEVNQILTDELNRLTKIIEGTASNKSADWFNNNIGVQLNKSPQAIESLEAVGATGRVRYSIVTAEGGTKTVVFAAGSAGSSGGQKSGTTSGGTKEATPFNKYVVTVKTDLPDYAVKSFESQTAAKALEFILNNGKNPMNLGADWQSGNSAKRALVGLDNVSGLLKNEVFAANFTLACEYVAVAKKEEVVAPATV
jgi:hypothetical protein